MTNKRTVTANAGEQSLSFSRESEAPAALVFKAHTDAALIARWIGPPGTQMTLREFDARTGGCWSYVTDLADGRSRIDGLSIFLSVEDRDHMLGDMDDGMDENFGRLEELLAATAAA
jgi:uncharacterized protein YndB with AHSA1/START domain